MVAASSAASVSTRPPRRVTRVAERLAELGQQLEPRGGVALEERHRPAQEAGRGAHVAAHERAVRRRGEPACRLGAEPVGVIVDRAELRPVQIGLLEMEAEDLRVLGHAIADDALQPAGVDLVQGDPNPLRQAR